MVKWGVKVRIRLLNPLSYFQVINFYHVIFAANESNFTLL